MERFRDGGGEDSRLVIFGFGKPSRWSEVWLRVRAALRRRSVEREIDGELAYHMEMRARDLEATGVAPHVARREAKSLFGDYGRIRSECRELMMVDEGRQGDSVMSDFMYDVRYTLRSCSDRTKGNVRYWLHPDLPDESSVGPGCPQVRTFRQECMVHPRLRTFLAVPP